MQKREERHQVQIPARLRWDGKWFAASIRNISSRGMMLRTPTPPPPGTYVEVQMNAGAVAARSVWTFDQACGLRTQDRLDVNALRGSRAGGSAIARTSPRIAEARSAISRPITRSAEEQAERSRRAAALFQFLTLVAAGMTAASSLAYEAYRILSAPVAMIEERL